MKILISLGVAFLATLITYLSILMVAPTMYLEKAFNVLAAVFLGSASLTLALLMRKQN